MKLTRVLNGIISLGLVAAVSTLPQLLPEINLQVGEAPGAIAQNVRPKNLSLSCPGAAYLFGGKNGTKVNEGERVGEATVNYSADTVNSVLLGMNLLGSNQIMTDPSGGFARTTDVIKSVWPASFTTYDSSNSVKQSAALLAASQSQVLDSTSANGLLATACAVPKSQQWIIGAEAITGRDGVLLLVNNTSIDSTISLEVYTDAGLITEGGLNGISVPKQSSVGIPIATIAPKAPTSAIKITASGGAVSAWVQQKTARGTQVAGADLIPAAIDPSKKLVIPGLLLRGMKDAANLASDTDYSDLLPSIDFFVPGDKPATITAQILGSDNQGFGTVINQTLAAGRATRVDITDLADGNYTIFVDSDQPIQAVARFSHVNRKVTPNSDFAYLPAVTQTKAVREVVVPRVQSAALVLANGAKSTATVEITDLESGKTQTVKLASFSSKVIKANSGSVYQVTSNRQTSATLVIAQGIQVANIALEPYQNLAQKIAVAVR